MVYQAKSLDSTFFALADPTRRDMISRLARGERTISELASHFDMSLPAVSKHVRMLERARLATVEQRGRVRHVRLRPNTMRAAFNWMEKYRHFWETELDLMATYLENPPTPETE